LTLRILRLALVTTVASIIAPDVKAQAAPFAPASAFVTVTTKGMGTIPSFTLGRPAALLFMHVGSGAFSFDPEFRAGLDGKPWGTALWGRYRLRRQRLFLAISAHPAINFRSTTVTMNGVDRDVIVARRYVGGEVAPTYTLSSHATLTANYFYLRGLESDVAKHTHFVGLRSGIGIPLASGFGLRLAPLVYYLNIARRTGYYAFGSVTLGRVGLPVSLSSAANGPMRTSIAAGRENAWNVSVNYAVP